MFGGRESVHLESWPKFREPDQTILADMTEVRRVVSLALEARAEAGIKVRQPLGKLTVKSNILFEKNELVDIIRDEVNVKEVVIGKTEGITIVFLDPTLTTELIREGLFRDFVRAIMEGRKEAGLIPGETAVLHVGTGDEGTNLLKDFEKELKEVVLVKYIVYGETEGEEMSIGGFSFTFKLVKQKI